MSTHSDTSAIMKRIDDEYVRAIQATDRWRTEIWANLLKSSQMNLFVQALDRSYNTDRYVHLRFVASAADGSMRIDHLTFHRGKIINRFYVVRDRIVVSKR